MIANAEAKKFENYVYLFMSCLYYNTFKQIANSEHFYFTDRLCIKINYFVNIINEKLIRMI